MAVTTMNLRLEAADGSGIEEYRIYDGDIEIRTSCSLEPTQWEDEWRRLRASEVADHVRRNTVVAQWLLRRLGWQRLVLACTEQETLEMFGVSEAPLNRHAA